MVITIVQIPRSGPQPDKATAIEGSKTVSYTHLTLPTKA